MEMEHAKEWMLDEIFDMILKRMKWMDDEGIKQWNVTNYTDVYPKTYYLKRIHQKQLYVCKNNQEIISAAVLLEHDDRWDDDANAYYIHHFVSKLNTKGAGEKLLEAMEQKAKQEHKQSIRLDCAVDNVKLNAYYQSKGYEIIGKCNDGSYKGYKREKKIK